MRCKACNRMLTDNETFWNEHTQEFNSLCMVCKPVSNAALDDVTSDEWQPIEPVYPHDLKWDGVVNNPPDSDD